MRFTLDKGHFITGELYIDIEKGIPSLLKNIVWIEDDFMSDENIEFDFEAFEIIDSGEKYVNPKHFSVVDIVAAPIVKKYAHSNFVLSKT